MKALVTGASSGIGKEMAKYLSSKGYDLILVSRDEKRLENLQSELKTNSKVIAMDLSKQENVLSLCDQIKDENIDILINDAGFGAFGNFYETNLENEINMIETNITALHILTKFCLKNMRNKNYGYILNVSSIASFEPGPLMATYYATKAYVTSLSRAISKELQKEKSKVQVSVLCPGPVNTNFNNVAGVKFSIKPISSEYVAKYAIDKLLKGKRTIIPGKVSKCLHLMAKIAPSNLAMEVAYYNQKKKIK